MSIGDDLKAKGVNPKLLLNPEKYLFDVVKNKNRQELQQLCGYDINFNIQDENGDSPLIIAIDMKEKKTYEPAEITIMPLGYDLLITSGGTLGEGDWDAFDFGSL